ncbi:MAG: TolC family protein, partial [Bacteroidales bacterium]|nr:TolC family protein [Bacteroidales bacterium]
DLDKTIKENRFNANLTASFGLNQNAYELPDAYKDPLSQQIVILGITIPLMDWGNSKGKKQMAMKNREVVYIEAQQQLNDFKQDLLLKVMDFNLQSKLVQSAQKAGELANESYKLTKNRFLLGNVDVLKITTIIKTRQQAEEKYINSVYNYWKKYYEIQQITLYDFINKQDLSVAFDQLIDD